MRRDTIDRAFPRWFLGILSRFYGAAVEIRNAAFTLGLLRAENAGVPVISVGNVTAGGTGKTPLVEYVARYALARGHRVAVVSRGYGRKGGGVVIVSDGAGPEVSAILGGDEPVQIAERLPGVAVVVGERRAEAARTAVRVLQATLIIMDDGFQHRALRRDLDIVLVHADRDPAADSLLPLGRRREPLRALRRAGFLVFSRAKEGVPCAPRMELLRRWYRGEYAAMAYAPEGLAPAAGDPVGPEALGGRHAFAFCGIGDPEGFLQSLAGCGIVVTGHLFFRDHQVYTDGAVEDILSRARTAKAEILVTTEKDAVRLRDQAALQERLGRAMPLYHLRIAARIVEGEDLLLRAVDRCLEAATGRHTQRV